MSPKLIGMKPLTGGVLRLTFQGKGARAVSLNGLIARSEYLQPLNDASLFTRAKIIDGGAAVAWPDDIEIAAGLLWRIAEEQSGFDAADFDAWQQRMGLSNQEAADALGIARSTLKSMKSGTTRISSAVAIACRAMESEPAVLAAHFQPRRAGRPRKTHTSLERRQN